MKLNNKGFMMAEVIVTCSIVVITLVGLFTSYNKTYLRYKERSNYFNVDNAYACNYLKDLLIENNILYNNTASYYYIDNTINDKISVLLNNYNITSVIVVDLSQTTTIEGLITDSMSNTYKDYLKYLNNSIVYDLTQEKYLLIMERQKVVNDTTNYYYGSLIF